MVARWTPAAVPVIRIASDRIFLLGNKSVPGYAAVVRAIVTRFARGDVVAVVVPNVVGATVAVIKEGTDDGSGSGGDRDGRCRIGLGRDGFSAKRADGEERPERR